MAGSLTPIEKEAILTLSLMAAFADGGKSEFERAELKRIAEIFLRATLFLLWLQILGTITPLFPFPTQCFTVVPVAPTLEGQYIIKNLVLVTAGLVIGATVRRRSLPGHASREDEH